MQTGRTSQAMLAIVAIVLATGLSAACGGGPVEISTAPMSGRIDGVTWSLGTAETNAFLSASSSDQFFVDAYAESLTPCTGAGNAVLTNRLILNIPKTTGDYLLGSGLNETFFVQSTGFNYVATQGRIVVGAVTATTLNGGGHFLFDDNNEVDGQFQVTICSQ